LTTAKQTSIKGKKDNLTEKKGGALKPGSRGKGSEKNGPNKRKTQLFNRGGRGGARGRER